MVVLVPSQDAFLKRRGSMQLFRDLFKLGKRRGKDKRWRFNHSSLYLDFLAGNQDYQCTAWGNPTRNVFGWQKPCYLLVGEGVCASYQEMVESVDWQRWGVGRNPKCTNCMVHCGFEPTAVNDAFANPLKAAWVAMRGPRTDGAMVSDPVLSFAVPVIVESGSSLQDHSANTVDNKEGSRRVA
jgi:hypothetical protein